MKGKYISLPPPKTPTNATNNSTKSVFHFEVNLQNTVVGVSPAYQHYQHQRRNCLPHSTASTPKIPRILSPSLRARFNTQHFAPLTYPCRQSPTQTPSFSGLQEHLRTDHSSSTTCCRFCPAVFEFEDQLLQHYLYQCATSMRLLSCPMCGDHLMTEHITKCCGLKKHPATTIAAKNATFHPKEQTSSSECIENLNTPKTTVTDGKKYPEHSTLSLISPIAHANHCYGGEVVRGSKTTAAMKENKYEKVSPGGSQENILNKYRKEKGKETPLVTKVRKMDRPRKDVVSQTGGSENTGRRTLKVLNKETSSKEKQNKITDATGKTLTKKRGRPKRTRSKVKKVPSDSSVPERMQISQDKTYVFPGGSATSKVIQDLRRKTSIFPGREIPSDTLQKNTSFEQTLICTRGETDKLRKALHQNDFLCEFDDRKPLVDTIRDNALRGKTFVFPGGFDTDESTDTAEHSDGVFYYSSENDEKMYDAIEDELNIDDAAFMYGGGDGCCNSTGNFFTSWTPVVTDADNNNLSNNNNNKDELEDTKPPRKLLYESSSISFTNNNSLSGRFPGRTASSTPPYMMKPMNSERVYSGNK